MQEVSIVIPCYNVAGYIVRCLDSIARQSISNYDVFLIDDCSTDNTVQIIEDYINSSSMRIHLLKNEVNSGPATSRKRGILESNAELICFCDSDDWYDPDYLQKMLIAQADNDADVVFSSFRLAFDSGMKSERLVIYKKEDLNDKHRILIKAPDSLCLMMVRRNILLIVPHPDIRNGEDMALIPLILSQADRFAAVNECMYNYYCREDSASMKPTMKMIESLETSFSFINTNLSADYQEEKEFIGIRNLLYGALLNIFKFSFNLKKANQIIDDFEVAFPLWRNNSNLGELPCTKRFFLKCVEKRWWLLAKSFSYIHRFLLK